MKRPRAYIPLPERLAAALAMLLPQEQRDDLRARKAPAKAVIRLFDMDHVVLHSIGGTDAWHNLTPTLRANHREKSRRDTAAAAKIKRLRGETCAGPRKQIGRKAQPWPPKGTRKIAPRGFQQGPRP